MTDQIISIHPKSRILITGASGDMGCALIRLLAPSGVRIGAQYFENSGSLTRLASELNLDKSHLHLLQGDLSTQKSCHDLVEAYVGWAQGIDILVQLSGNIQRPCHWQELTEKEWHGDIDVNLSGPFFLAQRAMHHMKSHGGRIVFTSTASAQHGGGKTSMAYGVAKAGIECLTKGLAREGAPHNILVNAVAPGFIATKFHTVRMKRDEETLRKRAELVPLKRAGTPGEVAQVIAFLLSSGADYITGHVLPVSGGDWL